MYVEHTWVCACVSGSIEYLSFCFNEKTRCMVYLVDVLHLYTYIYLFLLYKFIVKLFLDIHVYMYI